MQTHFDFIVLGGGISGLACALELQSNGAEVCLIEKSNKTGGVLKTIYKKDAYWERSAHTLAVDSEVSAFFQKYGVDKLLVAPSGVAKDRQIVVKNNIETISNHPLKILFSKFLSPKAKWKLLNEVFKKPIKKPNPSVREFFEYHFGSEITENIISAVFSGIYAGDINKMEMKTVMPKIYALEQGSGSLIRGFIKEKGNFPKRDIFGIKGGMRKMNQTLGAQINMLELNTEVIGIRKEDGIFKIKTNRGERTCKQLISCLPSYSLSDLVFNVNKGLSTALDEIQYNAMAIVHVAFDKNKTTDNLNAFGFLCSQYSSPVLKGAIYNSALFPERGSDNLASYSIFVKPKLEWIKNSKLLEEKVSELVSDFQKLTHISGAIRYQEITCWDRGIPQFNIPFTNLKIKLMEEVRMIDGLHLSGSYMSGVSVGDCIKYNIELAGKLLS